MRENFHVKLRSTALAENSRFHVSRIAQNVLIAKMVLDWHGVIFWELLRGGGI